MVALESLVLAAALLAADTVLLDFTAPWCPPCRSMEPVLAQLERGGVAVQRIDVDQHPQLVRQYRVDSYPTFVVVSGGQEIGRIVGATDAQSLRSLYQRGPGGRIQPVAAPPHAAPVTTAALTNVAAPRSIDHRGAAAPSAPLPPTAGTSAAGLIDQMRRATVRLRVDDPSGHSFGTGTIIDVHGREALVVTCGHLFRDSQGQGRVLVDLFHDQRPQTVEGRVLSYNLDRDIGLVSINAPGNLTAATVAPAGYQLRRGEYVFSYGCDRGTDPSPRESHITAVDKYLGPPNIEVAGQPIDGRSGGGLFDAQGWLIGICNAADPADNEGIYASLPTIHWELDCVGQRQIYERGGALLAARDVVAAPLASAPTAPALAPPAPPGPLFPEPRLPAVVNSPPPPLATVAAPTAPAAAWAANTDLEVICIVRSRSNPLAEQQLYILDAPPAQLLDQIASASKAAAAERIARQPRPAPAAAPEIIRAQSGDR